VSAPKPNPTGRRVSRLTARVRGAARREADPEFGPKALRLVLRELLFEGHDMPEWRRAARCAGPDVDPGVFFPPDGWANEVAVAAAKRACGSCPVRAACLADALAWEEPNRRHGVLGGLTATERGRLSDSLGPGGGD
jgi:WhiB family transcriptional regulator, redox-sensing transcriptional regulator